MESILEIIKPDTFPNLIGTLLICVSIVCLFTSFFEIHKKHATKVFSILLVASLALFSSYWATYFAAIFIVATAVTELEFLQTLAAIIRKDKNYFDFKKEALSKEDNIRRKAEEALEEELISSESDSGVATKGKIDLSTLLTLPRNEAMRLSLDVEEKTLNYLEKENGNIERNVRFRKNGSSVEFDGVIDKKGKSANKIFEIKWTRNPDHFFPFITHSIRRSSDLIEKYSAITGNKADFQLVVILNTKTSAPPERVDKMNERAKDAGITLNFLSLSEIGFDVSHEIA
jgi:hypothetical protein